MQLTAFVFDSLQNSITRVFIEILEEGNLQLILIRLHKKNENCIPEDITFDTI